jgi:hypothetical protein
VVSGGFVGSTGLLSMLTDLVPNPLLEAPPNTLALAINANPLLEVPPLALAVDATGKPKLTIGLGIISFSFLIFSDSATDPPNVLLIVDVPIFI